MISRAVRKEPKDKTQSHSKNIKQVGAETDRARINSIDCSRKILRSSMDVYVRDLSVTKKFYALAFGVALQDVVIAGIEAAATLNLYAGQFAIRWIQRDELLGQTKFRTEIIEGTSVKLEVEDLGYMVARAWEVGAVTIEGEEYETSHRCVVCMRDSDGLRIELFKTKLLLADERT